MPRNVAVSFLPGTRGRISAPETRRIAGHVLGARAAAPDAEIEVVFADAATVRNLNRLYRGKDEETDVLSFAASEGEAFPDAPDEAPSLGEVVVCVPFVERQVASLVSNGEAVTLTGQLAHLLVHGLLHLMGLDHEAGEAEAEAMADLEEQVLSDLGFEGLYVHGH